MPSILCWSKPSISPSGQGPNFVHVPQQYYNLSTRSTSSNAEHVAIWTATIGSFVVLGLWVKAYSFSLWSDWCICFLIWCELSVKSPTQYLHSIYTVYAQYIHNICTVYAKYIHNIYAVYAKYIHSLCTVYIQCTHSISLCSHQYVYAFLFCKTIFHIWVVW